MYSPDKPENISVAWFKLADLIARGEREKALNVYRLLSHSYNDKAFCLQLEGDILWSLGDQQSHEKYKQAAYLYKKDRRHIQSLAVCKHLLEFRQTDEEVLASVLELYAALGWKEAFEAQLEQVYVLEQKKTLSPQQVKIIIKMVEDYCTQETNAETWAWVKQALLLQG